MGQIGECVRRFEHLRRAGKARSHVAIVARHVGRRLLGGVLIGGENFFRPALLGFALIPFDGDEVAGLYRDPHVLGNHRNAT